MSLPKIGAVSYLNTKPLVAGADEIGIDFEWIFDLPSRLADRLAEGELTAALIPIVEAGSPDYTIVSNACIACRGPVLSVKLIGRVPPKQIKTLALDEGSRTSSVLAQVLLAREFSVFPQTVPLKMDDDWRTVDADAVLVIGDRAMAIDGTQAEFCWDLGEEWFQMTGLPFVFAVWAARPSDQLGHLDWVLSTSRDSGLEQLEMIAARYAGQYQMPTEDCLRYLGEHLHFEMGNEERLGAELFFKYASELGLLTKERLKFYECSNA